MKFRVSPDLCQICFSHTTETHSLFTYSLLLLIHWRLIWKVRTVSHREYVVIIIIVIITCHQQDGLILRLWTFTRGQTRTEHNPVASAFTCTSHAVELDCSSLFLFLSTSNYTMLVGWQLDKCFLFPFFSCWGHLLPLSPPKTPTEGKPNAKHSTRHDDDNFLTQDYFGPDIWLVLSSNFN